MKKNISALFSAVILSLALSAAANAQSENNSNQTDSKPLKILKKPIPESGGCNQPNGRVMVRVTFDKSAKVTDATITQSSGCASFDKNSVDAARRIKFEPQIKDGEPVTVTKPVEYKYYRY
jgi:protein TonB